MFWQPQLKVKDDSQGTSSKVVKTSVTEKKKQIPFRTFLTWTITKDEVPTESPVWYYAMIESKTETYFVKDRFK